MRKIYFTSLLSLSFGLLMINNSSAQGNFANSELAPGVTAGSSGNLSAPNTINALFDIQWSFFPEDSIPTVSIAGVVNTGTEIWVSRWNANSLFRFTLNGTFIDSFTVAGVGTATSGVRAFTFDGTNVWAAFNGTQLKSINPTTRTLVSTVTLPALTGSANALTTTRWATYDATLNGGAGGFWIGNFDTDIMQVSMTGALLNTIPQTTHGLAAMYGAAFDNLSPGGPFLWVNDQEDMTGSGSLAHLVQLDGLGNQTLLYHDVDLDFGSPGGIAGGTSISAPMPGFTQPTIWVNDQGVQTVAYELTVTGLHAINFNGAFNILPNPSKSGMIKIVYKPEVKEDAVLTVTDIAGKTIYTETFKNLTEINKSIPLKVGAGNYFVNIIHNDGSVVTKKLVVN